MNKQPYSKNSSSMKEQNEYLEEHHFINNIRNVFGTYCPYFGKLLYLRFSEGYDRSKIGLSKIIQVLQPLHKEEKNLSHNEVAFQILDIDRDGTLNILNLLLLQKHIPPCSEAGSEIFKYDSFLNQYRLVEYYLKHIVFPKNASKKHDITLEVFNKVVKKSCFVTVIIFLVTNI